MSGNYVVSERLKSREGDVVDVRETEKGYFVTMEFDAVSYTHLDVYKRQGRHSCCGEKCS